MTTPPINLRQAAANIHRDPSWWRKVLTGGALTMTLIGIPWAAGLVVESLENVRKGFPTPLPPGGDPTTRAIIGLFAVLIDFVFFLLLPAGIGLLTLCAVFGFVLSGSADASRTLVIIGGGALALYVAAMFALGVAPVGRLLYVEQGRAEDALGMQTVRATLRRDWRRAFARARLHSLPAYLPALLGGAACWLFSTYAPSGGLTLLGLALLLWLTASALVYAQLVVAQLYGAAARLLV